MIFKNISAAIKQLDIWFKNNHRNLDFRKNPTPYTTWISEVMAQQTTVTAVEPYFKRFMNEFPTIKMLAESHENQVLSTWSGLGYYSRARNIYKTAHILSEKFNSKLPTNMQELLTLPGIGRYTAGAILSLALNQPEAIVDTNIKRVLIRLKGRMLKEKETWRLANHLVKYSEQYSISEPHIINQAIMEVGALLCKPTQTQCLQCPLSNICNFYHKQLTPLDLPVPKPKKILTQIQESCLLFIYTKNNATYTAIEPYKAYNWTQGYWDLPIYNGKISLQNTQIINISYTITHHQIYRNIYIIPIKYKNISQHYIDGDDLKWIDLNNTNITTIGIPIRSALKKSLLKYQKINNKL